MNKFKNRPIVYLAGPLGFSEAGRDFHYSKLIPLIENMGFSYFDPWNTSLRDKINSVSSMKYGSTKRKEWENLNQEIGKLNQQNIDRCDFMLAVLDGIDIDSGTAAEIGYAFARNKRVIGYRGDCRYSSDNEGCIINLQVEYFIKSSGGIIVNSLDDLINYLDKMNKFAMT